LDVIPQKTTRDNISVLHSWTS